MRAQRTEGKEREGKMAYSNVMLKGRVGWCRGTNWPLIVMERAKSDKPETPVLCEVWGFEHECGSCYYKDIVLAESLAAWEESMKAADNGEKRYFKGELLAKGN